MLLAVESRSDEPGRRVLDGDVPDRDDHHPEGVSELRLAIAELADACPTLNNDLETIGDRVREIGIRAGERELESHPNLTNLVRLALEVFFLMYPAPEKYETDQRLYYGANLEEAPGDTYSAYRKLLEMLRSRLS